MNESSLVTYYAERAQEYERIYQKPGRQEDLRWLRDFVGRNFAGLRVCEIASGTGYWTESVSRTAKSVAAIDINEEVLAIARSKPIDPAQTTFVKADVYDLPAYPQKFDGGLGCFWWSHIPKPRLREFLQGFHQVLSPGARVVFVDNRYVEGSSTPISRTDCDGNTYQLRKLDHGSTHEVLKNFPTEFELRGAVLDLADAVEIKFLPYYWVLSYLTPEIP